MPDRRTKRSEVTRGHVPPPAASDASLRAAAPAPAVSRSRSRRAVRAVQPAPTTAGSSSSGQETKPASSLSRAAERSAAGSFAHVIGLDEAGRGPLAGPVVAAACWVSPSLGGELEGIRDSKATTEREREDTYATLTQRPPEQVLWAVSIIDHREIDEINILQASMKAMSQATTALLQKLEECQKAGHSTSAGGAKAKAKAAKGRGGQGQGQSQGQGQGQGQGGKPAEDEATGSTGLPALTPDSTICLVDGNRCPTTLPLPSKWVIKGDSLIYSIAAASVIAKVTRDRIMHQLDALYPLYGLAGHKGYPTAAHRAALLVHGPSAVHRLTYAPVKKSLELQQQREARRGKKHSEEAEAAGDGNAADVSKGRRQSSSVRKSVDAPADPAVTEAQPTRQTRGRGRGGVRVAGAAATAVKPVKAGKVAKALPAPAPFPVSVASTESGGPGASRKRRRAAAPEVEAAAVAVAEAEAPTAKRTRRARK